MKKIFFMLGVVVFLFVTLAHLRLSSRQPSLFSSSLIESRRNHGCVVDKVGEREMAILVGGRWASSVETLDLETRQHRLVIPHDPLLDINHIAVEMVPSLKDPTVQEVWVMCGFHGDNVNRETTLDHLVIVDSSDWTVKRGPRMDRPRGACTSIQLDGPSSGDFDSSLAGFEQADHSQWIKGRLVCAIGGFFGQHDDGQSLDRFSCYDRLQRRWLQLPSLPSPLDHHNSVHVKGGTCPDQPRDIVLVFNGRSGPYNKTIPLIHQLILGESSWQTWEQPFPTPTGAAAASLSSTGKIFAFGGIEYTHGYKKPFRSDQISILDVCTRLSCQARSSLARVKWAIFPCQASSSDQVTICGGASPDHEKNRNHKHCETFDLSKIEAECLK